MLKFIIIGLTCNSGGCYWAQAENKPTVYESVELCRAQATDWQKKSAGFFKMECMVKIDG